MQLETRKRGVSDLEDANSQLRSALSSSQAALSACQEQLHEEREAADILHIEVCVML